MATQESVLMAPFPWMVLAIQALTAADRPWMFHKCRWISLGVKDSTTVQYNHHWAAVEIRCFFLLTDKQSWSGRALVSACGEAPVAIVALAQPTPSPAHHQSQPAGARQLVQPGHWSWDANRIDWFSKQSILQVYSIDMKVVKILNKRE